MARGLCSAHRKGVSYQSRPFFCPGCRRCEQNLATGKVTGTEPRPEKFAEIVHRRGTRQYTRDPIGARLARIKGRHRLLLDRGVVT